MPRRIAIVGLNPGTAIYAYLMARHDYEVTIITALENDHVETIDLKPHAILNILNPQVTRLFSTRYLMDIMGIEIIKTNIENAKVTGSNEVMVDNKQYNFDKVIMGSETRIGNWYTVIQGLANTRMKIKIIGNDTGLNLTMALLLSEMNHEVNINIDDIPIDDDLMKLLPIKHSANYDKELDLGYEIQRPMGDDNVETLGKGFMKTDPLSGLDYVITRDYELIIMGKLMALRDLGFIDEVKTPRLEVGLGVNWSYVTIGLTRKELGRVYRDISSSKISYRQENKDLVVKALYRGNRLLSIQLVMHGIRDLNWVYAMYSSLVMGKVPFLLLDMGYEDFGTVRGVLEHLVMDILNL